MNRTQSAISLQVKRLEEGLGVSLFKRGARPVTLTAGGEMLFDYAQRVLVANDELVARLAEPALAGRVRLGAPETLAAMRLPVALARFQAGYPQVALDVEFGPELSQRAAFEGGAYDLLLEKRTIDGKDWPGTTVWREPLAWFARDIPPPGTTLPLIVAPEGCSDREAARVALDSAGRSWRVAYCIGAQAGALAAAAAGLGVAVLPRSAMASGVGNGAVRTLPANAGLPSLPESELRLRLTPEPTARAQRLYDFLIASLGGPADY
jgi:DNA-binding transcriptional LysR family regulator